MGTLVDMRIMEGVFAEEKFLEMLLLIVLLLKSSYGLLCVEVKKVDVIPDKLIPSEFFNRFSSTTLKTELIQTNKILQTPGFYPYFQTLFFRCLDVSLATFTNSNTLSGSEDSYMSD